MPDVAAETKVCPKCGGVMEKGTLVDYYGPAAANRQVWTKSMKNRFFRGIEARKVDTFVCTQCGYLESYLETQNVK